MTLRSQPGRPPVLASVLAAGLMLAIAGCAGQVTPLGPGAAPQFRHLRSPIVLQALRAQPAGPAGACPAGSAALSGAAGQCFRTIGAPVTITSAAVAPGPVAQPATAAGQPAGPPAGFGTTIALPGSDAAALTAVTTTAFDARGYLAVSVAGRTWSHARVLQPFTAPQFEVLLPTKSEALQFQRLLDPPA